MYADVGWKLPGHKGNLVQVLIFCIAYIDYPLRDSEQVQNRPITSFHLGQNTLVRLCMSSQAPNAVPFHLVVPSQANQLIARKTSHRSGHTPQCSDDQCRPIASQY
jgi:hypothetical protein